LEERINIYTIPFRGTLRVHFQEKALRSEENTEVDSKEIELQG
jgi:hypothetical protein